VRSAPAHKLETGNSHASATQSTQTSPAGSVGQAVQVAGGPSISGSDVSLAVDPIKTDDLSVLIDRQFGMQTPVSTSSPATPLPEQARQVAQQLAQATPTVAPGTTEITLNPEELGRVRMNLTVTDGNITLVIAADRPETTELMRRHINQLVQTYKQLGFESMTFSFAEFSKGNSQTQQDFEKADIKDVKAIAEDNAAIANNPQTNSDGRIDLRL